VLERFDVDFSFFLEEMRQEAADESLIVADAVQQTNLLAIAELMIKLVLRINNKFE